MCLEADCACETLAEAPVGKTPVALGAGLQRLARMRARADAQSAAWVAEAGRTDAARKQGHRSTTEWLAALSGEPVAVCRSQIAVADALKDMPEK